MDPSSGWREIPFKSGYRWTKLEPSPISLHEKAFKRVFGADELAWFLNYEKDGFATVCYSVKSGNTVCGLFFGYKSAVSGSDSLLFLDGVIFDSTLSYLQKKMAFSAIEGYVKQTHRCFAVVGIGTIFSENPAKFGYFPFSRQTLQIIPQQDHLYFDKKMIRNSYIELR